MSHVQTRSADVTIAGAVARACRRAVPFLVIAGAACTDEVSLGSWGLAGAGGTAGVAAATGGTSGGGGSTGGGAGTLGEGGAGTETCAIPGFPGPPNPRGVAIGTTTTNTDWFWPAPLESIEWDLLIERDHVTDGYFWAHQFGFSETPVGGFIGLQMNGGYRSDPPDGDYETADMVLIWIGGPPVTAELGDIPFPEARTFLESERGLEWWTIHAKVELEPCVTYGVRFGRESTAPSGDVWYGGWLHDGSTGSETFVGRILVPASWGPLSGFTTEITQRIDYVPPLSCREAEHSSALYSTPTANGGLLRPTDHTNRFDSDLRCATSRFTELPGGVRHELGL